MIRSYRWVCWIGICLVAGGLLAGWQSGAEGTWAKGVGLLELIRDPTASHDAAMSEALGADERGMKMYVMAFLKRGPNRDQDPKTAAELQRKHMENIGRMAAEGQLVVAGPFGDDGEIRGIYIFNTSSVDEAKAWTETDPAIAQGRLSMELHPWYGSAAVQLMGDLHKRLERKSPSE